MGKKINLRPRTAKKKIRSARSADEQYTGAEPVWADWEKWPVEQFMKERSRAFFYYNYFNSGKDLKPRVLEWMKQRKYSKADIAAVKSTKDSECVVTMGTLATCMLNGMPDRHPQADEYIAMRPGLDQISNDAEWLEKKIANLIVKGNAIVKEHKKEVDVKKDIPQMSVRDRVREQCIDIVQPIDEWLDQWMHNAKKFKATDFNVNAHFESNGVTQAHARMICKWYEGQLVDFDRLIGPREKTNDYAQLVEGYSNYSKVDLKKMRDALAEIVGACNLIIDASKAKRKKPKKAPSKEKLIARLKYCATDTKYNLASINPIEILDAQELWVFNVKTRKIGHYVVDSHTSSLSVKGTSIQGYNEKLSVQKTLRKPEEKLRTFKSANKVALRKFMDGVSAVETKLNGRINQDTVLLKAVK